MVATNATHESRESIFRNKGYHIIQYQLCRMPYKKTNRAANANDIHNSAPGVVTAKNASYLYLPPYLNNGYTQFRDPRQLSCC